MLIVLRGFLNFLRGEDATSSSDSSLKLMVILIDLRSQEAGSELLSMFIDLRLTEFLGPSRLGLSGMGGECGCFSFPGREALVEARVAVGFEPPF